MNDDRGLVLPVPWVLLILAVTVVLTTLLTWATLSSNEDFHRARGFAEGRASKCNEPSRLERGARWLAQ